jgi:hypothetical protein
MADPALRTAPPNAEANNQDVFIWALFLLGGADKDIDVEDIYLKSFELAPARLGWRTRPNLPDYKKAAKALQSIEATTHVGLVHRTSAYLRRLTVDGVAWVQKYEPLLATTYGQAPVPAAATNRHERLRRRLKASAVYSSWKACNGLDLFDLADAFECSAASPEGVWSGRLEEARRAAQVLADDDLVDFVEAASNFLNARRGGRS